MGNREGINIITEEISGSLRLILDLPEDINISSRESIKIISKPQIQADVFIHSGSQINFNIGHESENGYYRIGRRVNGSFGIVQDPTNRHLLDIDTGSAIFDVPVNFNSGSFITGSLSVMGQSTISGSLSTQMPTINIESGTGSINLNEANSFYLNLNSDKTHLIFLNHNNGQRVSMLINNSIKEQIITTDGVHNENTIASKIGHTLFEGICFNGILYGSFVGTMNKKII